MEGANTLSYELFEQGLLVMDGSGWSNWGFVKVLIYMCLMSVICICNRYYKGVERDVKFTFWAYQQNSLVKTTKKISVSQITMYI